MTTAKFREKLLGLQQNLLNFAFVLTSNRDDAYDLLQDTTLKVLDSSDLYQDEYEFQGLGVHDHAQYIHQPLPADGEVGYGCGYVRRLYRINTPENCLQPSPEDTYLASEIADVVNSFPDGYRIPFTMHVAGYKYAEIAERMHLPLGTVKSRIFYARKFLQARLADYR